MINRYTSKTRITYAKILWIQWYTVQFWNRYIYREWLSIGEDTIIIISTLRTEEKHIISGILQIYSINMIDWIILCFSMF